MHQHILHRLKTKGVHDVSNMVIVVTGCASRPAPHLMLDDSFNPQLLRPLKARRGAASPYFSSEQNSKVPSSVHLHSTLLAAQ